MIDKITNAAATIAENFKSQPMVLALLLVNIIFLVAMTFILREVSQGIERRDALIEHCLQAKS
jgi:hypothetical protein